MFGWLFGNVSPGINAPAITGEPEPEPQTASPKIDHETARRAGLQYCECRHAYVDHTHLCGMCRI